MGKNKTHEEFMAKVKDKNERVKNGEIEILGKYNGSKTLIKCRCNIHNITWNICPDNLYRGSGCKKCGRDDSSKNQRMSTDDFVREINKLNNGIKIIGEYVNNRTLVEFECKYGHVWKAIPGNILKGSGCPYCSNKKVLRGFNDLWTTHPDIAQLLQNKDDGYKYTYGSSKKLNFICPNCRTILNNSIQEVTRRGINCSKCSDSVSYPNKFSRALLTMLDVKNVDYEWQPDWLKPYTYDNYFETLSGNKYVLEMDGGIGHGNKVYRSNDIDENGIIRDQIKDALAREHNINIIRVNCNYDGHDRFEYIKQNLLNSQLSNIVDLSKIDWNLCHKQAISSLVIQCANLYNDGYAIGEISIQLGYSTSTIIRWLKQATLVNLCYYDKIETQRRGRLLAGHNINQYTLDKQFIASYPTLTEAEKITNVKSKYISRCCMKVRKSTGGFLWFYADDPEQPDKTKIFINNSTKLMI